MIELGKKYRTRDGQEVRIYAVDAGGAKPVHGAWRNDTGRWVHECWTGDGNVQGGCFAMPRQLDLVEVRPEVTQRRCVVLQGDALGIAPYKRDGWNTLGQIDITHDNEKLIRVEIVNG